VLFTISFQVANLLVPLKIIHFVVYPFLLLNRVFFDSKCSAVSPFPLGGSGAGVFVFNLYSSFIFVQGTLVVIPFLP
jgi:hypothetical protein